MDAMVQVGYHQLEPMDVAGAEQQVEQGYGIGTPRNRDHRAPSWLTQRASLISKTVQEIHARKLTRPGDPGSSLARPGGLELFGWRRLVPF